eukprot:4172319-Pyramimonas_sp.AAC.1
MPSLIFQRSSNLAPYATARPTMEAEMPAEVLLLEAFFQRVSERIVYASWRPTLWMSSPVVVTTAGVCCVAKTNSPKIQRKSNTYNNPTKCARKLATPAPLGHTVALPRPNDHLRV